jgi:alpha-ketoglutarate-dependent 2,4-dichlorophenoxyacetate dioxygenase
MTIEISQLHPMFGFELHNVDITKEPDPATQTSVRKALAEGGIVLIRSSRDEIPTETELVRFATCFGPIHKLPLSKALKDEIGGNISHTLRVTNLDADGNIFATDSRSQRLAVYNRLWHTDTTYAKPRTSFSFLLGKTIPPVGGETEFCDTRVAYENLPETLRARIQGLVAYHSIVDSRARLGFTDWTEEERLPAIPRPIVQVHEPSGRAAMCIAAHIHAVDGLDQSEGMALVDDLIARSSAPDRVYAHHWRRGDLMIWDNRCTMHRAAPYDTEHYGRDLRAVRLMDAADL